ncbi:hypothetical protein C9374_013215 [Naegleria lovaniensis]|uniref:Maelstrom domain-containing protein n=1 Tax=Naegleria lovaniensis TaxID=51637 RepID=A0AA88GDC6_NAELO|nr:uncharacterized protein C9374_013215 [Naegleria lovaniensis]KAG2372763.1 hypothetical protein C9374_013215 [Naegleria lovaniensis]
MLDNSYRVVDTSHQEGVNDNNQSTQQESILSQYKQNGFTRRRHLLFKVEGFDSELYNGNAKLKTALENQFEINICRLKIAFRHKKPLNFAAVELEEEILSSDENGINSYTNSTESYVRECIQKLDGQFLNGNVLHCDLLTDQELTYFMKKKKDGDSDPFIPYEIFDSLEHVFIVDFEMAVLGKYHKIPCEVAIAKFCLKQLKIVEHFHSFICPTYIPPCDFQTIAYTSQNIHGIPLHFPSYQELRIFDDLSKNYDLLLERIFKFLGCEKSQNTNHDDTKHFIDLSKVLLIAHAPHAENCSFHFLTQESTSYQQLKFPQVYDIKDFVTSYEKGNVYFESSHPSSTFEVASSTAKALSSKKLNDLLKQLSSEACDKKCHFHLKSLNTFHCALSDVFGIARALSCTMTDEYKNVEFISQTSDMANDRNIAVTPNECVNSSSDSTQTVKFVPKQKEIIDPLLYKQIEDEWTGGETMEYFYK